MAILDSPFVKVLKNKCSDYLRALRVPVMGQDPDKSTNLSNFYSDMAAWAKLVDNLFTPENCTPQFWETFGPDIKTSWIDVREIKSALQPSRNFAFDCLHSITELASLLKLQKYPGLAAFGEVITQYANDMTRDYQGKTPVEEYKSKLLADRSSTNHLRSWLVERGKTSQGIATLSEELQKYLCDLDSWRELSGRLRNWPPKSLPQYWKSASHFADECLRVLVRLTQQPDGALVSLWDLIDAQDYGRYLVIREIFARVSQEVPPPVPYDAGAAVFTKVSDTFAIIQQLVRAFDDWGQRGKA